MDTTQDARYRLFQQFEKELKYLGGKALILNKEELVPKLQDILANGNRNVVISKTPLLAELISKNSLSRMKNLRLHWLPETRPADFDAVDYRRVMLEADAGVAAADYLLADSGAVVLLGEHHRSQLATLLPPRLIVIATAQQIVENIHSLHKVLREENQELNASLHYIAGPSRTADIEKTLILGVHGPKNLYVLVIGED